MKTRRLLDLFCGAGGAAMGYYQAGYTQIVGVDNRPQKRYPFEFVQADAMEVLSHVKPWDYDLIHASPPCQAYSRARRLHGRTHPQMIEPVREALIRVGIPYVIENVEGAPLVNPAMLCGLMFGLKVFRHRLFETDGWIMSMPHIPHGDRRIGKDGFCCVAGHGDSGRARIPKECRNVAAWKAAMGIDWMVREELAQAIPPSYTHWIGAQLI